MSVTASILLLLFTRYELDFHFNLFLTISVRSCAQELCKDFVSAVKVYQVYVEVIAVFTVFNICFSPAHYPHSVRIQ